MARKRRKYPPELKAKVALEALREEETLTELASSGHCMMADGPHRGPEE